MDVDFNQEKDKNMTPEAKYENRANATATVGTMENVTWCKKSFEEDRTYIQCVYCGIYGHYSHFGEYMKVKVKMSILFREVDTINV